MSIFLVNFCDENDDATYRRAPLESNIVACCRWCYLATQSLQLSFHPSAFSLTTMYFTTSNGSTQEPRGEKAPEKAATPLDLFGRRTDENPEFPVWARMNFAGLLALLPSCSRIELKENCQSSPHRQTRTLYSFSTFCEG